MLLSKPPCYMRVVQDKRAANEALLHMQHTYRADPKCFFTQVCCYLNLLCYLLNLYATN